jgi:prephenate dehydrogenase
MGLGLVCFFTTVDAVDQEVRIVSAQRHLAALAFVASCDDDDLVAFANLVHGRSP